MQAFRGLLDLALDELDENGLVFGNAKFGGYAFYDYDSEPIYVGQTKEQLRVRVRRQLTNQRTRTDAVAMRVLDVLEVAPLIGQVLAEPPGAMSEEQVEHIELEDDPEL